MSFRLLALFFLLFSSTSWARPVRVCVLGESEDKAVPSGLE